MRRWTCRTVALLAALVPLAPGHAVAGSPQRELVVAAAADLILAFREIAPRFEQTHQAK